jgi:RNA polymerase sigma factor (TIGR02999 family)
MSPDAEQHRTADSKRIDEAALSVADVLPELYQQLRRLAQGYLSSERPGHTLSATALVHEAYLKLAGQRSHHWSTPGEFFGVAAKAMRRILVDRARAKKSLKRGGSAQRLALDDEIAWFEQRSIDLVALDAALERLHVLDPPKAALVDLRFFAGLEMDRVAEMLGLSKRSTERQWTLAKAWLKREMDDTRA